MECTRNDHFIVWTHHRLLEGNQSKYYLYDKGIGFMLLKKEAGVLLKWNPVSSRIISARLQTNFQKTTTIQVYAPTYHAGEEEKEEFYKSLQAIKILCQCVTSFSI